MTTLLLIRHGMTDAVGHRLVGRLPGFGLNAEGRAQAERLGGRLSQTKIDAIYSSPLERALSTAEALAVPPRTPVVIRERLTEIDFGEWTGKTVEELAGVREFQLFNRLRSATRPPGGEHIAEVQARMVTELVQLADSHPRGTIAVVSHGDPLRAAIGFFLGVPCDLCLRFELWPASLSVLELSEEQSTVLCLNDTGGALPGAC